MRKPALRGIEDTLSPEHADTYRRDFHHNRRDDYVLANFSKPDQIE